MSKQEPFRFSVTNPFIFISLSAGEKADSLVYILAYNEGIMKAQH